MVLFARFLGHELMENANEKIVASTLLKSARNYPFDFNKKWDSKIRSYGERFYSGVALGIITQDADRGYMYRQIPLGWSEEEAMAYLSKDSNIMSALNNELTEKDALVNLLTHHKEEKDKEKKKDDMDS